MVLGHREPRGSAKRLEPGSPPDCVDSQVTEAEARGFEPRKGVNPNRISSAAP